MEQPEKDESEYVKTTIEINRAYYDLFRTMFPQQGSVKWFVNKTFEIFAHIHRIDETDEEIKSAVNQVIEDMKNESP